MKWSTKEAIQKCPIHLVQIPKIVRTAYLISKNVNLASSNQLPIKTLSYWYDGQMSDLSKCEKLKNLKSRAKLLDDAANYTQYELR